MLKRNGSCFTEETKLTIRYIIVGSWNMAFGVTVFSITYLIIGADKSYVLVAAIAHPIGVTQSHFTQRKIVWRSNNNYFSELLKFGIVQTQGFISILLMMSFFIEILGLKVITSQILATIVITILSFIFMKYWTFAKKSGPKLTNWKR